MRGKLNDLTGRKFGRLTVVAYAGTKVYPSGGTRATWQCVCDCGKEAVVESCSLVCGRTKSCGCLSEEYKHSKNKMTNRKHGETGTRLYGVWRGMKQRCSDSNHTHYNRYGGRGIAVCDEWANNYSAFREWAIANGYDETAERGKCTIDRIDNDKGYCPTNCRLVGMAEQYRNRNAPKSAAEYARERGLTPSAVHQRMRKRGMSLEEALKAPLRQKPTMLTYNGQTKSMSEWANELGMSLQTLSSRLYRDGLSVEEALSKPVRRRV